MTKQEQIKEIYKILCKKGFDGEFSRAKFLYNAGYRKVFSNKDNFTDLLNEEIKELSLIERTRNETAKEFAEKLRNKYGKSCSEYYPELIELTSIELDELLKEYEVEE